MAQQASVVRDGVDQLRTAVRRVDRQFRRIQRQVETRRKQLGKRVTSRRKAIEKRAQRELARFQREIQRQPLVKRAESLRADATRQLERGVASFLDALPIVTKREVERIDKKIALLSRKLRELERTHGVAGEA
jgi:septation ring formation regulator EzrA